MIFVGAFAKNAFGIGDRPNDTISRLYSLNENSFSYEYSCDPDTPRSREVRVPIHGGKSRLSRDVATILIARHPQYSPVRFPDMPRLLFWSLQRGVSGWSLYYTCRILPLGPCPRLLKLTPRLPPAACTSTPFSGLSCVPSAQSMGYVMSCDCPQNHQT